MDKSLLDSAVKLGLELMASESDLPKESVEAVLSNFRVSEICDSFNYSVIQVLEEKRCEFDEFVAELMTEDEWSEYLKNKYSRVEFENLSLMNTKELSFSYHKISSALGFVGQRKKYQK